MTLKYKGYIGSCEVDVAAGEIVGKLDHIRDLVTFCAKEAANIEDELRNVRVQFPPKVHES